MSDYLLKCLFDFVVLLLIESGGLNTLPLAAAV